jgi:hypothetical protein
MPRKNKVNSKNEEGFKEGGFFGNIFKKVTRSVTNVFMGPINALKKAILVPIGTLEDFFRTIVCLAVYLQMMFEWVFRSWIIIQAYFFASPFCFMFWILDSFMRFSQYIIIDVILGLVLLPAIYVGKLLNYPFVGNIQITSEFKKALHANTNVIRLMINGIDNNLNLPFKIYDKCFNIGRIQPFPTYHS